ncbi:hypothetical protein JCM8208_000014 [Rhodotorula glutinis]
MSPSPAPAAVPHTPHTTSTSPAPDTKPPQREPTSPSPTASRHAAPADDSPAQPDTDDPQASAPPVAPPTDAWQAVFSQDANAWYFWNAATGETTWTNPRDAPPSTTAAAPSTSASTSAGPSSASPAPAPAASSTTDTPAADPSSALPDIDPDLAWLDPALAARQAQASGGSGASAHLAQKGRFHARTGRFMADPSVNPDRVSQFQRGHRQQEAYYDVQGWEQQLAGRGLKRAGGEPAAAAGAGAESDEAGGEAAKRRPSAKQVDKFRRDKEEKKRKKLRSQFSST